MTRKVLNNKQSEVYRRFECKTKLGCGVDRAGDMYCHTPLALLNTTVKQSACIEEGSHPRKLFPFLVARIVYGGILCTAAGEFSTMRSPATGRRWRGAGQPAPASRAASATQHRQRCQSRQRQGPVQRRRRRGGAGGRRAGHRSAPPAKLPQGLAAHRGVGAALGVCGEGVRWWGVA